MKHVIWYTDNNKLPWRTGHGSDNLQEAIQIVTKLRTMRCEDGSRRYERVWIAGEIGPGPLGYFTSDPEPIYETNGEAPDLAPRGLQR